jgi:hypothetical protein
MVGMGQGVCGAASNPAVIIAMPPKQAELH